MRFLIDAQLPPALAAWLTAEGHQAQHVAGLDLAAAPDREIWRRAQDAGATIITKDQDFAQRRSLSADGPPIVWLRTGNMRRRALLEWFAPMFAAIVAALERGDAVVEVRQ